MRIPRICFLLAMPLPVSAALAQSNEVFLGQVGDTNTITIDQTGLNNLVGGLAGDLRLNQLGDRNAVTILQIGENNGVGRINLVGQPGLLTGQSGQSSGLRQSGDGNVLDIAQRTMRGDGGNLVGAIGQTSLSGGLGTANDAVIRQTGGAAIPSAEPGVSTGLGFHRIGEIAQTHRPTGAEAGANRIEAEQTGLRQTAWQLHQDGAANTIALDQAGEGNSVRMASQTGAGNGADVRQTGIGNTLGNAMQSGDLNRIEVEMDGDANLVDTVIQVGRGARGGGNIVSISISGNGNGGEGIGGFGAMSAQGRLSGAYAASLEQYGDDNTARLTIGSGAGGQANGNFYSVSQTGVGNGVGSVIAGNGNMLLLRQSGDGNILDILQDDTSGGPAGPTAQGHVTEILQAGDRNTLFVRQTGTTHRLDVRIEGSDNDGSMAPGGLEQEGFGHLARLDVTGDANTFSMVQSGSGHVATGRMVGEGNAGFVRQAGRGNIAAYIQFGASNFTLIQQE